MDAVLRHLCTRVVFIDAILYPKLAHLVRETIRVHPAWVVKRNQRSNLTLVETADDVAHAPGATRRPTVILFTDSTHEIVLLGINVALHLYEKVVRVAVMTQAMPPSVYRAFALVAIRPSPFSIIAREAIVDQAARLWANYYTDESALCSLSNRIAVREKARAQRSRHRFARKHRKGDPTELDANQIEREEAAFFGLDDSDDASLLILDSEVSVSTDRSVWSHVDQWKSVAHVIEAEAPGKWLGRPVDRILYAPFRPAHDAVARALFCTYILTTLTAAQRIPRPEPPPNVEDASLTELRAMHVTVAERPDEEALPRRQLHPYVHPLFETVMEHILSDAPPPESVKSLCSLFRVASDPRIDEAGLVQAAADLIGNTTTVRVLAQMAHRSPAVLREFQLLRQGHSIMQTRHFLPCTVTDGAEAGLAAARAGKCSSQVWLIQRLARGGTNLVTVEFAPEHMPSPLGASASIRSALPTLKDGIDFVIVWYVYGTTCIVKIVLSREHWTQLTTAMRLRTAAQTARRKLATGRKAGTPGFLITHAAVNGCIDTPRILQTLSILLRARVVSGELFAAGPETTQAVARIMRILHRATGLPETESLTCPHLVRVVLDACAGGNGHPLWTTLTTALTPRSPGSWLVLDPGRVARRADFIERVPLDRRSLVAQVLNVEIPTSVLKQVAQASELEISPAGTVSDSDDSSEESDDRYREMRRRAREQRKAALRHDSEMTTIEQRIAATDRRRLAGPPVRREVTVHNGTVHFLVAGERSHLDLLDTFLDMGEDIHMLSRVQTTALRARNDTEQHLPLLALAPRPMPSVPPLPPATDRPAQYPNAIGALAIALEIVPTAVGHLGTDDASLSYATTYVERMLRLAEEYVPDEQFPLVRSPLTGTVTDVPFRDSGSLQNVFMHEAIPRPFVDAAPWMLEHVYVNFYARAVAGYKRDQ